jgi:hypothetical protein
MRGSEKTLRVKPVVSVIGTLSASITPTHFAGV